MKKIDYFGILWERVKKEIPGVSIAPRNKSWCLNAIFGKNKDFVTTVFKTIYVPDEWERWPSYAKYRILRHELMHLRQFRNWPSKFFAKPYLWYINALIMSFCYLFVSPIFLTYRSKFEKEGYTQTMLVDHELGLLSSERRKQYQQDMNAIFTDKTYFYMTSLPDASYWSSRTLYDILTGRITNDKDRVD